MVASEIDVQPGATTNYKTHNSNPGVSDREGPQVCCHLLFWGQGWLQDTGRRGSSGKAAPEAPWMWPCEGVEGALLGLRETTWRNAQRAPSPSSL